jgi:hypothetical protein
MIRLIVVATIGAGLDAAALGCICYVQAPGPSRDADAPDLGLPTAAGWRDERLAAGKSDR